MSKPRKLIHLGLHKTGSTLLQALWAEMPEISLSKEFAIKTVFRLRDVIWGQTDADFAFPSDVEMFGNPGTVENPFQVFSAENLSNPTLASFSRERLDLFHRYTPEVFGHLVENQAQVLLVVREPRSWLRSMYKQYIHEGGSDTFRRYLVQNEQALAYVLSLEPILSPWTDFYGAENVTILPYELLRDDKQAFAAELHQRTGIPGGSFLEDIRLNVSVDDAEAELLRVAARLMKLYLDNVPTNSETGNQLRANAAAISDILRIELQRHPGGHMARLSKRLGLTLDTDVELPETIREAIGAGFLPTLERHGGAVLRYMDLYRRAAG